MCQVISCAVENEKTGCIALFERSLGDKLTREVVVKVRGSELALLETG
jgi:hypothetical protein